MTKYKAKEFGLALVFIAIFCGLLATEFLCVTSDHSLQEIIEFSSLFPHGLFLFGLITFCERRAWLRVDDNLFAFKNFSLIVISLLALFVIDKIGLWWISVLDTETTVVEGVLTSSIENMIFQGFMFNSFFQKHRYLGVFVSALLFALVHGAISLPSLFMCMGSSFVLSILYIETDYLILPMVVFMINNMVNLF